MQEWKNKLYSGLSRGKRNERETWVFNVSSMSAYTSGRCVCVLWTISEHLPSAAILVPIWEQIINILLLMKDTLISPDETAWRA